MTAPLGVTEAGRIVWPNGPYAAWWERLAWGAYGDRGWRGRLITHVALYHVDPSLPGGGMLTARDIVRGER